MRVLTVDTRILTMLAIIWIEWSNTCWNVRIYRL